MGSASDYLENKLLNHVLKVSSFSVPTNLYVSLHTADPTDTGTGTEVSGTSYARTLCNGWTTAASRASSNSAAVTFPAAGGSWGTITHWAVWDASTGGNCLFHGSITTPNAIIATNIVSFAIGQLSLSFVSGVYSNYLANKLLDHVLKVASYTVPTNIYVGLSTANPGDSGSGLSEPSGNAYARTLANSWSTSSAGASSNSAAITFTTATGSWGTITHAGLFDASSAGNNLMYGALGSSQAVVATNTIEFATSALAHTLT